jgi:hypothetical protein
MNEDLQRAQLTATEQQTQAIWTVAFIAACLLAPALMNTVFGWALGLAFLWAFFKWSGVRTAMLLATGALFLWVGTKNPELATWGWWLVSAGLLNSFVAQVRAHGWNHWNWWDWEGN